MPKRLHAQSVAVKAGTPACRHGLWPWMNAKGITLEASCVGGYASADSAEEHGGTTGFARGAPFYENSCLNDLSRDGGVSSAQSENIGR